MLKWVFCGLGRELYVVWGCLSLVFGVGAVFELYEALSNAADPIFWYDAYFGGTQVGSGFRIL